MLIACHLCIGTILGVLLADHYRRPYLLPVCMIASLLPDIIDKPLGYIILPDLGDGRLIAHSLIGLILISGISFCLFHRLLLSAACAAGVSSHQVLDAMWKIPQNWFYPFLGPFPSLPNDTYFETGFMRELATPSEWAFSAAIIIMLWGWYGRLAGSWRRNLPYSSVPAIILLFLGR